MTKKSAIDPKQVGVDLKVKHAVIPPLKLVKCPAVGFLVSVGLLSSLLPSAVGCYSKGVRDSSTQSRRVGSPVVSPLAVTVESPAALAGVNALAVLPTVFESRTRSAKIDEVTIAELVESVATQELDLKVYGRQWVSKLTTVAPGVLSPKERLAIKKGGADGVLLPELLEYVERNGSSLGGEPAAVAFRLSLFNTTDGKLVWQATYSQKQEALTDNLLKIGDRLGKEGSGAGWNSGSEALKRGLGEAFRDLRSRREQQFLSASR
jgi:hypothetical protein